MFKVFFCGKNWVRGSILILLCFAGAEVRAFQSDSLGNFSYTLDIPEGWKMKENCTENDCSFLAPQDTPADTFLENINITVADAPSKNYPVTKYTDFSIGYLPSVIENFELVERKKLPGNSEYIIYKGLKSEFHQTWKQYYHIKGSKMYIVTFTAETVKFEEYIARIQKNLDTFIVK